MQYSFSDNIQGLKASAIREILKFTQDPEVISFAAGNPAPEAFPVDMITEITNDIFQSNPISALQYSITEGYTPLRDIVKKRLILEGNFNDEVDDIIITSGAQQANELSCKVLLNKGDTLICESPSFIGSLNSFKSYGVSIVGIELESDGIDIYALEQTLNSNEDAKLIYLIPNFQNPTGRVMSLEKRKAVYKLAQKHNLLILEDNPYGYLRIDGEEIPSIKSLDTDGRVIYSGSFSKILAPGLRVGYVVAPKEITQKIVVCKQVSDVHTNIWAQMLCYEFLSRVDFGEYIERIRKIYEHKCSLMISEMQKHFSKKVEYNRPEGGLFIWCTLPNDCDMMTFCKRAVSENKVAVVPGNAFLIENDENYKSFRMNFSSPTDEQIVKGCEQLGILTKELFD